MVIWSDNTGAEAATRKGRVLCHTHLLSCLWGIFPGSAKRFDQNCLIHALWKQFVQLRMAVWVMRVPSKENIADDPSRED